MGGNKYITEGNIVIRDTLMLKDTFFNGGKHSIVYAIFWGWRQRAPLSVMERRLMLGQFYGEGNGLDAHGIV